MSFNPLTDILAAGGINFKGAWDANTNTPSLASGSGTASDYYVVGETGTTTLDGVSSWDVNDWAVFNGTVWQKVSNEDQSQLSYPEPIIFRPGGPSLDEPGIYGTWLGVMAFVATLNSPVTIVFDSSLTSPCVIPTGTHTFPVGSRFRGVSKPANTLVTLDDGAVLVGIDTFEGGLTVVSDSTSPVITFSGGAAGLVTFQGGAKVRCDAAGPFIQVTGSGTTAKALFYAAEWLSGSAEVLEVITSASATVDCLVEAVIGLDTLAVDGTAALTMNLMPNTVLNPTQTGVSGLYDLIYTHTANQTAFDKTVLSSQLTALTVQEAIDELTLKHTNKQAQTISSAGTTNLAVESARLVLIDMAAVGAAAADIYLPAISADSGPWMFKRLDSNTASTVKIHATGGDTIDLLPFQTISGWPSSMHLVAGPAAWYRI